MHKENKPGGDPESEEDHLVVVRKPKQLAGIMRGDIFEYLVAQYI